MKANKPKVVRVLMEGTRGFINDWQFGSWHEEYTRLKKKNIGIGQKAFSKKI